MKAFSRKLKKRYNLGSTTDQETTNSNNPRGSKSEDASESDGSSNSTPKVGRRYRIEKVISFSASSRQNSFNSDSLPITPISIRKLSHSQSDLATDGSNLLKIGTSFSSFSSLPASSKTSKEQSVPDSFTSLPDYCLSSSNDERQNEFGHSPSFSIGTSPSSSALNLSLTSDQSHLSLTESELRGAGNTLEESSDMLEKSTSSGVFKNIKFSFGKKERTKRTSRDETQKQEDLRSSATQLPNVGTGNSNKATQILEKFKENNEALALEVRGKDEELNILNATLDQVNQTWESHMQAVRKQLESQKQENEQLRAKLAKESASGSNSSKQPVRVPVFENTRKKTSDSSSDSASHQSTDDESGTSSKRPVSSPTKRRGVHEPTRKMGITVKPTEKNQDVKDRLFSALSTSKCLSQLSEGVRHGIVDIMKSKRINRGERLMQEGVLGLAFYVLQDGDCKIYKQSQEPVSPNLSEGGRPVGQWEVLGDSDVFYHTRRVWSCKCVRPGLVWYVTRDEFRAVVMKQDIERRKKDIYTFLKEVKSFEQLHPSQFRMLSNVSRIGQFADGDYIIREGNHTTSVYVIKEGEVIVTKLIDGSETRLATLSAGELFGNLQSYSHRQDNNVIATGQEVVQCIVIPIKHFDMIRDQVVTTSSSDDLTTNKVKDGLAKRLMKEDERDSVCTASGSSGYGSDSESQYAQRKQPKRRDEIQYATHFMGIYRSLKDASMDDFEFIATIGKGAFGSVDLVSSIHDADDVYAVKKLSKEDVVASEQQKNVYSEKNLQMSTSRDCPFITSLYSTFKDNRFVYFVMEYCPGGELFSLLRQAKAFNDSSARFYVGCVIEALTFLHSKHIIFRDLKPENVVLDRQGYCKLTDFGFAKKVSGKSTYRTYSYCGTPEYMAPEIILYQAHSFSVDLWSLGVFIFETLTGRAPFRSKNRAHLSDSILIGMDPKLKIARESDKIDATASSLIQDLCYRRPEDRLGSGRNGISEVTRHAWFRKFDWESLRKRILTAPWKPKLSGSADLRYFAASSHSNANFNAKEEFSGWDENF